MATNSVNLIDAIAEVNARQARYEAVTIRIGVIVELPSAGEVAVTIGGFTVMCQWLNGYYPLPGDKVAILASKDALLIIGSVDDQPAVMPSFGGELPGTYGPNYGAGPYTNYYYRFGPFAYTRISATRINSAYTCPSTGYISPAHQIFLPDINLVGSELNSVPVSWAGAPYGFGHVTTGSAYLTYIQANYTSIAIGADFTTVYTTVVDNPD